MIDVALLTAPAPVDEVTGGHRYNGEIASRAARHGVRIRTIPIAGRTLPSRIASARRALRDAERADVVVVDSIAAAPLAFVRAIRTPHVALVHQVPRGVTAALSRRTYRRCDLAITVSPWVSAQLRGLSLPRAVVEPGIDPAPMRDPRGDGDAIEILCVANWLPDKGILALAEAMSRLPDGPQRLHLVGAAHVETRYGRSVAARIARSDLRRAVVARGTLRDAALADAFARADIFALPAEREAFGIAFGEALAAGLPVVGCRSGNIPELVGHAGILVERGDVEALAWALAMLVADPDRRRNLAARARDRARTLRSWDEAASAFFSALRSGTRLAPAAARDERDRAASSA